jgi:MFS transporter, DHA2 family, methylenomycin A resistance protein
MRGSSGLVAAVSDPAASSQTRLVILVVVASAQFMAVMSLSVVSIALPTIGRELHATNTGLEWVVDAYQLVFASLLVAAGVLGDRRGRKGMFMLGVGVFALGSLVAGTAPSIGVLIGGRLLQGLGPAIVAPTGLAIISATFTERRERARAIGVWSSGSGLGLALGPVLGGVLVDGLGWRAVFFVNVPLALVIMAVGAVWAPRIPHTAVRYRFDWGGAVLTTAAVALLTFGIIEAPAHGWLSGLVVISLVAGLASLAAFVAWERRQPGALIDVSLFGRAPFTVANVAGMSVFFAFVGAIVYLSAYFQQVQHRSALVTGLCVLPIGLGFFLGAPLSGRIVGRLGARSPMIGGLMLCGAATLGLLRLAPRSPFAAVGWDLLLVGLGAGLCLTPMTTTAVAAVDHDRAGMASAIHNSMRQFGQALGVAVLGVFVYARIPGGQTGGHRLGPTQSNAFVSGLHLALLVSGICLLLAAALAALLIPRGFLRPEPALAGGAPAN